MSYVADRRHLLRTAQAVAELKRRRERALCESSLIDFLECAWPHFDPSRFVRSWHLEAICEHLEAISYGQIRKLLVNIPPRHTKTSVCSIGWPAWTWILAQDPEYPLVGAQVRFMCMSYGHQLAIDTATTMRRLIEGEWYKKQWGDRVKISADQSAKERFDTTAGGYRLSSSIAGATLGRGGDVRIIDDANKVDEAESEVIREGVNKIYDEALQSRVTDPKTTATVIIAQRVHENDLSGHILDSDPDFVHLCLPAEFESGRRCVTVLGWEDPRQEDGELICPERFSEKELASFKSNPFMWAGQFQQRPEVRGGAIIKREYWRIWDRAAMREHDVKPGTYPPFEFALASFDGAFTEKQENDFSALTVWGVWIGKAGHPQVMLCDAWQKRLTLHGTDEPAKFDNETKVEYDSRRRESWGVVEHLAASCRKHKIDKLLIESKANGITVAQEMRRLYARDPWVVQLSNPGSLDKVARIYAVQHLFADGMIWRPDTDWSQMVEDQCASFPKGTHDDIVDTVSQALNHLRKTGFASRRDESIAARDEMQFPSLPQRKKVFYES